MSAACGAKSSCCGPSKCGTPQQQQPERVSKACCGGTTTQPERVSKACCGGTATQPERVSKACCGGTTAPQHASNGAATPQQSGTAPQQNGDATYEVVKEYYGKVLSTSKDLKTNACCASGPPPAPIRDIIRKVPDEIVSKFYGCGAPLPLGINGLRVLDLGSGSGRDSYVCSALVGEQGSVTGIDMTDEQIAVAQKYVDEYCMQTLGYKQPNLRFMRGHIEYLDKAGIEDGSIDIVISNCVVNLSPDKPRILSEVYRVLAAGGEFYFSDVYCDRRMPQSLREDPVLWGECLSGALYTNDFVALAKSVGFADPRVLSIDPITVANAELQTLLGEAKFYSITYRLFKLPELLEPQCEDYGQFAVYKGTIAGHEHAYQLDSETRFVKGKPMLVDGNTAAMVGENGVSWLSPHFNVVGDRSVHYGEFDCGSGGKALKTPECAPTAVAPSSGGCC